MTRFVRIDEWGGFLTQEMYNEELEEAKKNKDSKKVALYTAIDKSTFAESEDDIWILNEYPNVRINLKKCLKRSMLKRRMYDSEEDERIASTFTIGRQAFQNQIHQTRQYLSYFTEFYDPEKELLSLYMHMKNVIDSGYHSLTIDEFKKHLMGKIFRDYHIKENLYRLAEDNHYIDATTDTKTGRKFDGPYDFTNEDIKRLEAISFMMKIIIPPTEHYIATNTIYSDKDPLINKLTLDLFIDIFYKVGDQFNNYEADILQEKIYVFTEKKVGKHYKGNKKLWEQQAALRATTETSHLDRLLTKFLLADNFFKFRFNSALTAFLKAIIGTQLKFTVERLTYNFNPIQVDSEKGPDGLSGIDKLEQTQMKVDETKAIRTYKALRDVVARLENEYGEISEDEISFYMERLFNMDKFHSTILNYNFAKEFEGFTELKSASIRQIMKFVIICKRELSSKGYKQLQWFISSIMQGKLSNRLLQNNKYINKLKSSSTYKHLIEDTYKIMADGFKDDPILKIISRVLNNRYVFMEYEQPELTGETIVFNEDIISDEILNFIDSI